MTIQPVSNRIAIRRTGPKFDEGVLVLPETVKARLKIEACRGQVIAIGPGRVEDCVVCKRCTCFHAPEQHGAEACGALTNYNPGPDGRCTCPWNGQQCTRCEGTGRVLMPIDGIAPGDEVVFLKTSGEETAHHGEELLVVRDWAVVAKKDASGALQPLQDRLFIKRDEGGKKTRSGLLYVPDTASEFQWSGVIVKAGPGVRYITTGELGPMELRVGNRVLIGKYHPDVKDGDETYVMMSEGDVLGVYEESAS